MPMPGPTTTQPANPDYRPFPDKSGRNTRQAYVEVPIFVRALGIRPGTRILEIGCGRGTVLPVNNRLCRPDRLVGIDIDNALLTDAAAYTTGLDIELVCADVRATSQSYTALGEPSCGHPGAAEVDRSRSGLDA
jgi:protein-L-isoaspartate O-methyltransferase